VLKSTFEEKSVQVVIWNVVVNERICPNLQALTLRHLPQNFIILVQYLPCLQDVNARRSLLRYRRPARLARTRELGGQDKGGDRRDRRRGRREENRRREVSIDVV
jgi:hypothetical protein